MGKISAVAVSVLVLFAIDVRAELRDNAVLYFNQGTLGCALEAGQSQVSCDYGAVVANGSYFAIDANGNGIFQDVERTALIAKEGLRLGVAQPASGSHFGYPDGTELASIDQPWAFFGNTGMTQTITAVTISGGDNGVGDGVATLDMTGLGITWNGIPNIPMAGDPANFPGDTGIATVTCESSCAPGEQFVLSYRAHVPMGDPSGFGGVWYELHLEGAIADGGSIPPTSKVDISLVSNNPLECTDGGATISAESSITTTDINDIDQIVWTLDGVHTGTGSSVTVTASLGSHVLGLNVSTFNSGEFTRSVTVNINDTLPPVINAEFVSGENSSHKLARDDNGKWFVNFSAEDQCDGVVPATAVLGMNVNNGDRIKINKNGKKLKLKGEQAVSGVMLHVESVDSSQNKVTSVKELY